MESDEDSRSSSNSSDSSNSSSNNPASPTPQENESNDQQPEQQFAELSGDDSNSVQQQQQQQQETVEKQQEEANQSMSPVAAEKEAVQSVGKSNDKSKDDDDDEEELELSDIDEENSNKQPSKQADISHEDLSDISDLESSNDANSQQNFTDLRQKLEKQRQNGATESVKKNDEEELDFEDEDEIKEDSATENVKKVREVKESIESGSIKEDGEHKSDKEQELESGEELEDGEVTDGDEKRPEESEPKAVCRFFTRGQCTWGMSCRFLHPGTTDKGNYTMFDMVRPMPSAQPIPPMMMPAYDYRTERPPLHHMPPHAHPAGYGRPIIPPAESESAWERGLRTAKEMMRKASRRKEQDIDFDEKKMNLSGPPDAEIIERDPYYRGSPDITPPPFERERIERRLPPQRGAHFSPPSSKFPPRSGPSSYFEEDQYGRMARSYRELPAHRMPHYEDDNEISKRRTVRTTREVIVEKADDWSDPWMRKEKGKDRKARGRERSYSSNSSYSSSSSSSRSRSRSSSDSSHSPSPGSRRRSGGGGRFDAKRSKEKNLVPIHKQQVDRARSSSINKRRHSPVSRSRNPMKKATSPIPALKRKKPNSPSQKEFTKSASQRKKRDSSSGSSSASESGSSYSSSTSSSKGKKKREKIVSERKPVAKKAETTKKHPITPPPSAKDDEKLSEKAAAAAKLKSTRREELLKQLRAVEDAIARKRSKIK